LVWTAQASLLHALTRIGRDGMQLHSLSKQELLTLYFIDLQTKNTLKTQHLECNHPSTAAGERGQDENFVERRGVV
jgi:hypothetical protein